MQRKESTRCLALLGTTVHDWCQSRSFAGNHQHVVEVDGARLVAIVPRFVETEGVEDGSARSMSRPMDGEHAHAWFLMTTPHSFRPAPPSKLSGSRRDAYRSRISVPPVMWLLEMQLEMHPLVRANQRSPVASCWLRLVKVELLSTRLPFQRGDRVERSCRFAATHPQGSPFFGGFCRCANHYLDLCVPFTTLTCARSLEI